MTVSPFNGPWWAFLGVMVLVGFALHRVLRGRDPKVQRYTLASLAGATEDELTIAAAAAAA